jgi:peroxiredoxin
MAESTPFEQLVATIKSDVVAQLKRVGSVDNLANKFVGKKAPKFKLSSLTGKPIRASERAGKIVVLHFWEYQGKPLVEPYGQVGYLDFLNGKRRKLGVKIYGVAVDARLAKRSTTPAALRSIRKLKSFMNLSYEVAVDDGTTLKLFGDPRAVGAKLPLWVVIDTDGKIKHYKAGFYKIRADEGLRTLDTELIRLIRANRNKK